MRNLETRIRNIAADMDARGVDKFAGSVPHSVFVDWDSTWDLFEGEDDRWVYASCMGEDYSVTPESTDEEIEEAILDWEASHEDYYEEEIRKYAEEI